MIPRDFVIEMVRNPHKLHVIVARRLDARGYSLMLIVDHTSQFSVPDDVVDQTAEQIIAYARGLFDGALGMLAGDSEYTKQVAEFRRIVQEILEKFTRAGIICTYNYPKLVLV